MGVTKLFHFRRFLRRDRRVAVADGSRHFVIGLDKTSADANTASLPSTEAFPKGSHFMVAFNHSVQLSEEEMDACNNNGTSANNAELMDAARNARGNYRRRQEADYNSSSHGESVIFAMMPGANPLSPTHDDLRETSNCGSSRTVPSTTELEETRLFGRS